MIERFVFATALLACLLGAACAPSSGTDGAPAATVDTSKRVVIPNPNPPGWLSPAVQAGHLVFLSGQIPLDPATMEVVDGGVREQIDRVFRNLLAVANAAGGDFSNVVKLNAYLTDLSDFPLVNEIMAGYFDEPYPARAAVGVASLPKGVDVEADAILAL